MTARALRAQTKLELILTLRRGEAVLLTLIIPVGLLVFFGTTELFAVTVEFITPGLLALAVLSSSLVSLSASPRGTNASIWYSNDSEPPRSPARSCSSPKRFRSWRWRSSRWPYSWVWPPCSLDGGPTSTGGY